MTEKQKLYYDGQKCESSLIIVYANDVIPFYYML